MGAFTLLINEGFESCVPGLRAIENNEKYFFPYSIQRFLQFTYRIGNFGYQGFS